MGPSMLSAGRVDGVTNKTGNRMVNLMMVPRKGSLETRGPAVDK
jgi:hypothetical protein